MAWIALTGQDECWFNPDQPTTRDRNGGIDMTAPIQRGSIVAELRFPLLRRPKPVFFCQNRGPRPFHISLQAMPGGGISFVIDIDGQIGHRVLHYTDTGRADILRFTYSWDTHARQARVALERADRGLVALAAWPDPQAPSLEDAQALVSPGAHRYMAPDLVYLAMSRAVEPVGPTPGIHFETPVATPDGYRSIGALRRGDLVLNSKGQSQPVLHLIRRTVPARGSYAPLFVRAPYFGLLQDINIAPYQTLAVAGSGIEYLFGHDQVLVHAKDLTGRHTGGPVRVGRFVTYAQPLLPEHDLINVAGGTLDSLFIGRLRRRPEQLAASLMAPLDRQSLPEHTGQPFQTIGTSEAAILAEHRTA